MTEVQDQAQRVAGNFRGVEGQTERAPRPHDVTLDLWATPKTVPISAWSVRSFRIRPQDFEVRCLLGPSADTGKHGAFQQAADSSIQEFNRMLCSELWILWIYSGKPNADDFRAGNAAMPNDYALDFFRPGTLPRDLSSCAASARIVSLSMSNETLQYI